MTFELPTTPPRKETEPKEIGSLAPFNEEYFTELGSARVECARGRFLFQPALLYRPRSGSDEARDRWRLYDTPKEKNVTHTVVDP
ncbi:hypothetical protein GF380_05430 [Candidatus Uhrbacteria bacterium]|nr:hypothetical protein [Candidatus Uhrbacteria bacterium]MBD3284472.1 hypothetical protein [Candidatus Uhrbacteria bacterium]